ncbi:MAG: hypothetical protein ABI852_16965 [Gemmatimonadaceae bacterium]
MPVLRKPPFIAALACVVLLPGCFVRGGGKALMISSVASDYSPVVTFAANVRIADSVRVDIARLQLLYPGEVVPGVGPVTGPIEMQALIVVANPAADLSKGVATVDRNGVRKPWVERSISNTVRLSDGLTMGAVQTAGPIAFTLPLSDGIDLSTSWLVFRLAGPAVMMTVRMADGSQMASPDRMPPIRVFACAVKNLNGKTDAPRQIVLKEAYSAGC